MKLNELINEKQDHSGYEKGKVKHDDSGFELYHPNPKVQALVKGIATDIGRKYKGWRNMGNTASPSKFRRRAAGLMTSWRAQKDEVNDIKTIINKHIKKSGFDITTKDAKDGPFDEIQIIVPHELSTGEQMKLV